MKKYSYPLLLTLITLFSMISCIEDDLGEDIINLELNQKSLDTISKPINDCDGWNCTQLDKTKDTIKKPSTIDCDGWNCTQINDSND